MRRTVTFVLFIAFTALGQDKPPGAIKTVGEYCIAISKKLDAMDDTEGDTLISDLPEANRAKVTEYLQSLHTLRDAIRHDACDSKDLKSASATTRRDLRRHAALTDEMLAYAHNAIAEAYRKKAQSEQSPK